MLHRHGAILGLVELLIPHAKSLNEADAQRILEIPVRRYIASPRGTNSILELWPSNSRTGFLFCYSDRLRSSLTDVTTGDPEISSKDRCTY